MLFENKSALVTAAGAGIGRAIAVKLAAEGARVVVSDVDDTAGAETVELIVDAGGTAVYQHANVADYGAAKHGVVSLTMSAAAENAAAGIRINAVAPGPVLTAALASLPAESRQRYADEVPMRRLGDPEDIAEATAFLLSDAAGFITGVTLPVEGGARWPADRI